MSSAQGTFPTPHLSLSVPSSSLFPHVTSQPSSPFLFYFDSLKPVSSSIQKKASLRAATLSTPPPVSLAWCLIDTYQVEWNYLQEGLVQGLAVGDKMWS